MWRIVLQEEKRGKSVRLVHCKHLQFFPIEKKQRVVGFGQFKFKVLRVQLTDGNEVHSITWNNASSDGKFIYHWPDKMVWPTYKAANGRVYEDRLSPQIKQPGEKVEFSKVKQLLDFLVPRIGQELAAEIVEHFTRRMAA